MDKSKFFYNKNGYLALIFIGKTITFFRYKYDRKPFVSEEFEEFMSHVLQYFYENRNSLNFDLKVNALSAEEATQFNEIQILVFTYVVYILNKILIQSTEFRKLFVMNNCLEIVLLFFSDNDFITKNKKTFIRDPASPTEFPVYLAMILTNTLSTCDDCRHKWNSLNAANVLLKIDKTNGEDFYNQVIFILAFLLDDKKLESFVEIDAKMIEYIQTELISAKNDFDKNNLQRMPTQIIINNKSFNTHVHLIQSGRTASFYIIEILEWLYKLSVNEKVKVKIYFNQSIHSCFKTFLEKGNYNFKNK